MLSRIALLLLLVGGASCACKCMYESQPPSGYNIKSWSTFYIQNPFDDSGSPCNANCTYKLDSTDPSNGISKLAIIQWDGPSDGNTLTFYDTDADGNKLSVPIATTNGGTSPSFITKTQYLIVELTMIVPRHILATLEPVSGLATTPAPVVSTTTVPPTPYTGEYADDPAKISNDLLIMVDAGAGKSEGVFNETKILAASIVEVLTNVITANASFAPGTGTRLAVNSLTKINTQSLGTPWNSSVSDVSNTLKNAAGVLSFPANYSQAIEGILPNPTGTGVFGIKNQGTDAFMNSRPHVQRTLLIVTANVPANPDQIVSDTADLFTNYDVHPVLIAYQLPEGGGLEKLTGWDVYYAANNSAETVKDFVNTRLLKSDKVCSSMKNQDFSVDGTSSPLLVPSNYKGATANQPWQTSPQIARYCNFQQVTYNFNVASTTTTTYFTVYYELETDKDFLRFQDSQGNHLASFSGTDVSGSKFSAKGNITAVFSTNESQVFGGFRVEFTKTAS